MSKQDAERLRMLAQDVNETDKMILERIAYQLESDAKRYDDSCKLQEIGKSAFESIADMVAALECDYDRLEELKEARQEYDQNGQPKNADDEYSNWSEHPDAEKLAELEAVAGDCESREDAEQRIHEDPLSIEIHGEWTLDCLSDGAVNLKDAHVLKAEILLGTGGPATRIVCELNGGEPTRAWIQAQDWFLPWTDYVGGDSETLLTYCRCFYFGEG